MHDTHIALADLTDEAVALSAEVVPSHVIAEASDRARLIRKRLSHPGDVAVVAIAGGTGSGKSSLFNAVVGSEVVVSSGVRPTTTSPTAATPESAGPTFDLWLQDLGVTDIVRYPGNDLVWLDLPDSDSTELANRETVDDLVPVADFVVWVADPEKYRDRVLHSEFLGPLQAYRDHVAFVLNQMDRLGDEDATTVIEDFKDALGQAGYPDASVLPVAADPVLGPPFGVEELIQLVREKAPGNSALQHRIRLDAGVVAAQLRAVLGPPLDFDRRADRAVRAGAAELIAGRPPTSLTEFFVEIADETPDSRARDELLLLAAEIPTRSRGALQPEQQRRWWRRWAAPPAVDVAGRLDSQFIRTARALLVDRARAQAAVNALSLRIDDLGDER